MRINNNINSLYIFQSDEIASIESETKILIWNGYQDKQNFTSIPKYLEDNANKFKKKYIEFIHDIGTKNISNKNLSQLLKINKNYNLWWMSLLTEKSHYKSPRIKDCLKLFALEEMLIKNNMVLSGQYSHEQMKNQTNISSMKRQKTTKIRNVDLRFHYGIYC